MNPTSRPNPFLHRQPLQPAKDAFFARIRAALNADPAVPFEEPPAIDESLLRQVSADAPPQTLIDCFIEKARANSITVHPIAATPPSPAAVHETLAAILAPHAIKKTILNFSTPAAAESLQIPAFLAQKQIEILPWPSPNCREAAFQCDASITDCRAAIADSGSLMVWTDPGNNDDGNKKKNGGGFGRSTTLVVPLHIILLQISQILPDLIDALAHPDFRIQNSEFRIPSNIVLINGPSKTADIEMNLITGVHGPKFLHVILLHHE